MKAAIYKKYGPPSVINVAQTAKPKPADREILVKVHATTVNRTDTGLRSAKYFISRFFTGLIKPKNNIQGCEFAGEVASIGSEVDRFRVGDRVFGFDDTVNGGHAEYMTIAQDNMVTTVPDGVDFQTAVAAPEGAHYFLNGLRAADVKKGQSVFVHGATGSIGSAAVQILNSMGAIVTASSRKEHFSIIKKLGAIKVIDYQNQEFTDLPEKFDVVFDSVGKSTFGAARNVLKADGKYLSSELGPYGQNPLLALRSKIYGKQKVLFPIPTQSQADMELIRALLDSGELKPLIDSVYSLDDIAKATVYVESEQKVGSVVINVIPDRQQIVTHSE